MDTGEMECTANRKPWPFSCAACKTMRKKCGEKCVLAPYFPPDYPEKFKAAHRVFGASNIIKMLQDLPNDRKANAVRSMVYEANARLRDPVYGCAGTIHQLQHQMSQLQSLLTTTQAELRNMRLQQANLLSILPLFYTATQEEEPFSSVGTETEAAQLNPQIEAETQQNPSTTNQIEEKSNRPSNATTKLYSKCLEGAAILPQSDQGFNPLFHLQQVLSPSQIAQMQAENPGKIPPGRLMSNFSAKSAGSETV